MILVPLLLSAMMADALFPNAYTPARPKADAVVASVNGRNILASDIEPYLWDWLSSQATQDLVSYRIVADEADKKGVTVDDAAVTKQVDQQVVRAQEQTKAGENVEALLHDRSMPKSRLFLRAKAELLLEKLAALDFKKTDYVKTSTFAVTPKSESAADVSAALTKANGAYGKLVAGAAWEKVLKEYTTDERVIKGLGALDWVPVNLFPATTQAELAKLKNGQYTKPVQTSNGFQIFRVDSVGADLSGAALDGLKEKAVQQLKKPLLDRLLKEAKVTRNPLVHG